MAAHSRVLFPLSHRNTQQIPIVSNRVKSLCAWNGLKSARSRAIEDLSGLSLSEKTWNSFL